MTTFKFDNYTGGIFEQKKEIIFANHVVSVVGWGVSATGEEFWVVRNSWGSYWGEQGFFRIKMHKDNLGIETGCNWAVPIIPDGY